MHKLIGYGLSTFLAMSCISAYSAEPAKETTEPTPTSAHESSVLNPAHHEVTVKCVNPYGACPESHKVIETLQTMVKAINNGDWKTYESYLDDHCSTFDENTKRLIAGKENVLADMKAKIAKSGQEGHPLVHVTIEHPYAKVMPPANDTAVVTLLAIREYGGKHPFKEECRVTDIFTKHGDVWKKSHFRGAWKKV